METYVSDDGTVVVNVTPSTVEGDLYNAFVEYADAAQTARENSLEMQGNILGAIGIMIGVILIYIVLGRL